MVELRPAFAGRLTTEEIEDLAHSAEHLIKAYVGVTAKAHIVAPGTIERSQGKAKRVLDLRPKT